MDLSSYRQQVTELGKSAVNAEKAGEWEMAFEMYQKALKLFIHLIKCKLTI